MDNIKSGPALLVGGKPYNPGTPKRNELYEDGGGCVHKAQEAYEGRALYEMVMTYAVFETLREYEKDTGVGVRALEPRMLALQAGSDGKEASSFGTVKVAGVPGTRLASLAAGLVRPKYKDGHPASAYTCIPTSVAYHLGVFAGIRKHEGFIHGDLDPRNIKFDPQGPVLYVCDLADARPGTSEQVGWEDEALLNLLRAIKPGVLHAYDDGKDLIRKRGVFFSKVDQMVDTLRLELDMDLMRANPKELRTLL
ncbi:hypothetical protein HY641_02890 [Candidatus Woesearchaeota archaeon]|nr:hypothetical protein [Candidatus Woesearchaeota archaeon]